MAKIEKFEDLKCWQESRILARMVFKITENGQLSKNFGLKDQIQRAGVSVMNNIAEGFTRHNNKEFRRYLTIAQSSNAEVLSMLYLLDDIGFAKKEDIENLRIQANKTRHMILAMIKYLNSILK